MIVLFGTEGFTAALPWTDLAPLLPGWEIRSCAPDRVREHLDDVDVYCPFGTPVGRDLLAAGPFGLLQQYGVGVDNVDLDAATELGVRVARLPGDLTGNADAVAEMAVLQVLALLRRLDDARAALRERRWNEPAGRTLAGATVLVVGLGAIGTALVPRLAGFGPRILAVRGRPERGGVDGVEQVFGPDELHAAAGRADVVVCCAMMGPDTEGMFGAAEFAAFRPGAVFVNVARGRMVDEAALLAALRSGAVGAAGLDVHADEPADPSSALLRHPGVLATPHVAGMTEAMFRRSGELFARNVLTWADGGAPEWTVNAPERPRRPVRRG